MEVFLKHFFYLAKFLMDAEDKGFLSSAELDILNLEIPRWLGGNVIAAFKLLKASTGGSLSPV